MPDYKMADINPEDYKPIINFDPNDNIDFVKPEDLRRYMVQKLNLTPAHIQTALDMLKNHKLVESSWWQKLLGYAWYGILDLINDQLTPKKLAKILTNLDQLLPYFPTPFAQKLIRVLDKLAESWYKSFE